MTPAYLLQDRKSGRSARLMTRVLLTLGLAVWLAAAQAADWVYTVRPGDSLWTISEQYLKGHEYWSKVQQHNNIADPKRLPPGTQLRIPVAWLKQQPTPAKVISVQGTVQFHPASGEQRALSNGDPVHSGDEIRTGADGSVSVEFADGSRLLIERDSTVRMDSLGTHAETGMVDTTLHLKKGRVESDVRPQGNKRRYQINTPAATAAVRGTRYRVVAEAEQMRSEVLEGNVGVAGAGVTREVNAGFGVRAETGKPPSEPRALLEAPKLGGLPRRVLLQQDSEWAWTGIAGAVSYRLQLGPDPEFTRILRDAVVTTPHYTLPKLAAGNYVLRVRAVDELGFEGADAHHNFNVGEAPAAPRLHSPGDASIVFNPQPWMSWSSADQATSYHLQLARDSSFTQLVADVTGIVFTHYTSPDLLGPGDYHWRVSGIDVGGLEGAYSAPRRFTIPADAP